MSSTLCFSAVLLLSISPALVSLPIEPFFWDPLLCLAGWLVYVSDNEDGSLRIWLDAHRTWVISVQLPRLGQTCSSGALSTQCAPLRPGPCVSSAVLLLRISPALVSLPIKRFLSPASLFGYAPASGFTIGLCPINSDNNDSFSLFDWIVTECGSSEFSQGASANLAVLS